MDTGWVPCPMVDDGMICLGCCLDFQSVARSEVFDTHSHNDFPSVAKDKGVSVDSLRQMCIKHQITLIDEQVREGDEYSDDLLGLRTTLIDLCSKLRIDI